MKVGFNDSFKFSEDPNTIVGWIAKGIATIRAAAPTADFIIMAPSTTNATTKTRDVGPFGPSTFVVVAEAIRQFCYANGHAFFDTLSVVPFADTEYMDVSNGFQIHPQEVMNAWIGSHLQELIFPQGLRGWGREYLLGPQTTLIGSTTAGAATYSSRFCSAWAVPGGANFNFRVRLSNKGGMAGDVKMVVPLVAREDVMGPIARARFVTGSVDAKFLTWEWIAGTSEIQFWENRLGTTGMDVVKVNATNLANNSELSISGFVPL